MSEAQEGFEIQVVEQPPGYSPWFRLVHKPCGSDVHAIDLGIQDLEWATTEAYNHLLECPVILKSDRCWAEFPAPGPHYGALTRFKHKYSDRRVYACADHAPRLSSAWVEDQP